mmetsp:Transcript_38314/g.108329  ORF Transcript_38314/g.108329 Transcript_38314/m.108329 type:complete len:695 (+) Transcript_38314:351-2435(+)
MSLAACHVADPEAKRTRRHPSQLDEEELIQVVATLRQQELQDYEKTFRVALKGDAAKALEERRKLVKEAKNAFGSERATLEALKERYTRVGVTFPSIIIKYRDLTVERMAASGKGALPAVHTALCKCCKGESKTVCAVTGVSGRMKPGKCTLVLGPPGSGKSTLMQTLSGRVRNSKLAKITGSITYNNKEVGEVEMKKTTTYIDQVDRHIPILTVTETIDFSAILQGGGDGIELINSALQKEAELSKTAGLAKKDTDELLDKIAALTLSKKVRLGVDFTIDALGLTRCADTFVGDALIRGCSGGERKRVTTGEMYVGPAKGMFFDEISTGLDSASTYQVTESIVSSSSFLDLTCIVSLLQPEQQVYELFDEILVMAEGHIIYHGPKEHLLGHFYTMGFESPEEMTTPDFAQNVTSKQDQAELRVDKNRNAPFVPVSMFVEAWHASDVYKEMMAEMAGPIDAEHFPLSAIVSKKNELSPIRYFQALITREWTLLNRELAASIVRVVQATLLGATAGLLFFNRPMDFGGATNIVGAMAFGLNFIFIQSMATVSSTYMRMPVFFKQRDNLFFPGPAILLPQMLVALPAIIVESFAFCILLYFLMGLTPTAAAFVSFLLVFLLMDVLADQMFRVIGAFFPDLATGNAIATSVLLVLQLTNGLTIMRQSIPPGWSWAYWISPFSWSLRSVVTNEFLQDR